MKFKGKVMNFGSFSNFENAVQARKKAEEIYFGEFLESYENEKERLKEATNQ